MTMTLLGVSHLHVTYGAASAVRDLSFAVKQGEIVCLVGSNGAGKSSSLKAVMGIAASTGTIDLGGRRIDALPSHQRVAAGLALVPEGRHVFPQMSVRDNLLTGLRKPDPALAEQRMDDICALFPVVRERMAQMAGTMSGGEQQMVAIGRALMSGPRVLLLDEPTLGLAPAVIQRVGQALRALRERGLAIVLAEQNLEMALGIADRGCVLESGHLVFEDTADRLRREPRVIQAYLGAAA